MDESALPAAPSALLVAALRAAYPGRDPGRLAPLGEGLGARAFHWGDATAQPADLVVREPKDAAAAQRLGIEARLLPALDAAAVPHIPREVRAVLDGRGVLLAVVHRYVDGASIDRRGLAGRHRERLAGQLAAWLAALHRFPTTDARSLGVPPRDLRVHEYVPLIRAAAPHLGPRSGRWVEATAARLSGGRGGEPPRTLVHGDISTQHLLVGEAGDLVGVIDFDRASLADPAIDFAGVALALGWPFMEQVVAGYGEHGGPSVVVADAGLHRRARSYLALEPLYGLVYGNEAERERARRSIAARAGAAGRRD